MPRTLLSNAVCLGCGCLCDDVPLELDAEKISAPQLACEQGRAWFQSLSSPAAPPDASQLDRAAKLLNDARMPLVCGLKHACTRSQRLAVEIADRLGGCVDWTTSQADAASTQALQTLGGVSASLGEVAQRADLVIFWRCDPAATHPRHSQRYSLEPFSPWLPDGRGSRQAVLIGDHRCETGNEVDLIIEAAPAGDLSAIAQVRGRLAGVALDDDEPTVWAALADRIRHSRFTAVFYDAAIKQAGHAVLEQLTLLAQQVQQQTRLVLLPLGAGDNAPGAASVMAWQTGYPLAVSFAKGYPEYGPAEFTTELLLANREVDAALVVSAEGLNGLGNEALAYLKTIPTVVLGSGDLSSLTPNVPLPTAPLGAKQGGSVHRCDGIALPLEHDLAPSAAAQHEVLEAMSERICVAAPK